MSRVLTTVCQWEPCSKLISYYERAEGVQAPKYCPGYSCRSKAMNQRKREAKGVPPAKMGAPKCWWCGAESTRAKFGRPLCNGDECSGEAMRNPAKEVEGGS